MPDTFKLDICVDCLTYLANGEVLDADGEDVTEAHGHKIAAQWDGEDYDLTLCQADEGGFSWHSCDGCASTLGGDRFPAVAQLRRSAV